MLWLLLSFYCKNAKIRIKVHLSNHIYFTDICFLIQFWKIVSIVSSCKVSYLTDTKSFLWYFFHYKSSRLNCLYNNEFVKLQVKSHFVSILFCNFCLSVVLSVYFSVFLSFCHYLYLHLFCVLLCAVSQMKPRGLLGWNSTPLLIKVSQDRSIILVMSFCLSVFLSLCLSVSLSSSFKSLLICISITSARYFFYIFFFFFEFICAFPHSLYFFFLFN